MGALDTLIKITFATLLAKRFIDWDAYKLGLIDKKGNKIHEPKTKEEKKSLTTIKNLVRKVKRTLVTFTPDTPTVNFLLAMTLMKESNSLNELDELNSILTEIEKHYFNIYLKEINMKPFNEIIQENLDLSEAKTDKDIANLPPQYKKALAPFESVITTAYIDDKTKKTIVYINDTKKQKEIEKAVGKENIDSIKKTADDIKITLK